MDGLMRGSVAEENMENMQMEISCLKENLRDASDTLSSMRDFLKFLRDHPGECIADHPKWIERMEALIGNGD